MSAATRTATCSTPSSTSTRPRLLVGQLHGQGQCLQAKAVGLDRRQGQVGLAGDPPQRTAGEGLRPPAVSPAPHAPGCRSTTRHRALAWPKVAVGSPLATSCTFVPASRTTTPASQDVPGARGNENAQGAPGGPDTQSATVTPLASRTTALPTHRAGSRRRYALCTPHSTTPPACWRGGPTEP